jgi:hypothetical protein
MSAAAAATRPESASEWPDRAAGLLRALRERRTRVHAITNAAAQGLTANLLLAAGGTPSLTVSPDEITAFAARADALLVNLGTLDADRRAAIRAHLDRRFVPRCFARVPYLHRYELDPGVEPVERALIARGEIQATGVRYAGELPMDFRLGPDLRV